MYKVTIVQLTEENDSVPMPRYEQLVDQLDVKAVIDAVNRGSIVRRIRKPHKQESEIS